MFHVHYYNISVCYKHYYSTGSETLKKHLLWKKLSDCQSHVFIHSDFGKMNWTLKQSLLPKHMADSSVHSPWDKVIFRIQMLFNCKDRFKLDGVHPNITASRLLGANRRRPTGMSYINKNVSRSMNDQNRQAACISPSSPDPLLHITLRIQWMFLYQSGIRHLPSALLHTHQSRSELKLPHRSSVILMNDSTETSYHHSAVLHRGESDTLSLPFTFRSSQIARGMVKHITAILDNLVPVAGILNL